MGKEMKTAGKRNEPSKKTTIMDLEEKIFLDIEKVSVGLKPNQRKCPQCGNIITSHNLLVECYCKLIAIDAGGMHEDGKGVRILVDVSKIGQNNS